MIRPHTHTLAHRHSYTHTHIHTHTHTRTHTRTHTPLTHTHAHTHTHTPPDPRLSRSLFFCKTQDDPPSTANINKEFSLQLEERNVAYLVTSTLAQLNFFERAVPLLGGATDVEVHTAIDAYGPFLTALAGKGEDQDKVPSAPESLAVELASRTHQLNPLAHLAACNVLSTAPHQDSIERKQSAKERGRMCWGSILWQKFDDKNFHGFNSGAALSLRFPSCRCECCARILQISRRNAPL